MFSPSRSKRAQVSIELLIISFFAIAILLSLFSIYANMQNIWAGGTQARHAQMVADRLAGAIVAVGQGIEGSEAAVSLADAEGLELSVQGRSVRVSWAAGGGTGTVSSPTLTDDIDFEPGAKVVVRKENGGKIVVRPV